MAHPETRAIGAGRDLWGLRKDGSKVPVEIGLSPIQTHAGTLVLASIVDISERKRAKRRCAEARSNFGRSLSRPPSARSKWILPRGDSYGSTTASAG